MAINELFEEWKMGGEARGNILFHKKAHRHSGENTDFLCLRGATYGCSQPVNCEHCFHKKEGSYCLKDGQSVGGLLIEEDKHSRLVEQKGYGAYDTLAKAIDFHSKKRNIFPL